MEQSTPRGPLRTMQAAMALSPTNKASYVLSNGDTLLIQEDRHEHYRIWVVPPEDVPIWAGELSEAEIDDLPAKFGADPAKRAWEPLGLAPDHTAYYQAMETALQLVAGQLTNLRTELLVVKALVAGK